MFSITTILRLRVDGKLVKRETVRMFDNRQEFEFALWSMLGADSFRINDKDAKNVILKIDNGV